MTQDNKKTANDYSFAEGYELLMKEWKSYRAPIFGKPSELPLENIKKAHSVFQPRHIKDVSCTIESENHICELVEALHASSGGMLDPITVYWTGQAYRVIDGHHRLEAYSRVFKDKPKTMIPVQTFEGTPNEAIQKAIELNSKNHLPISKDERFDRAWLMVAMEIGSKSSVSRACKIGTTTYAAMKKRLLEMQQEQPESWREDALECTWKEAQKGSRKVTDHSEDWKERQANDLARRLGKSFGKRLTKQPEITARAFEIYSEKLTKELFGHWWSDFSESYQQELEDSDF